MKNKMITISVNALAKLADTLGIPGGAEAISFVVQEIREDEIKRATEELLKEVDRGDFSGVYKDEKIEVLYRYLMASANGTARINLRLLAKLIKGMFNNEDIHPEIYADEFVKFARILADLSYEEIIILAALNRFKIQNELENNSSRSFQTLVSIPRDSSHYSKKARDWLAGNSVRILQSSGIVNEEKGQKLIEESEFTARIGALTRTGLVYTPPSSSDIRGEVICELTYLFFELTNLVEFKAFLNIEENEI